MNPNPHPNPSPHPHQMKADAEELKALVKGKSVEELFETAEFKRLIALNGKFKCDPG